MTDTIPATVKTHTALPWELGRTIGGYIDIDALDGPIPWTALARVVVEVDGKRSDEGEANAAFIVRACNSHYQLVKALRRNLEGWENAIELGLIPERHRNTAQILAAEARAALSQAGGASD